MASATQISILEYMHTSYRPDREFVDGEVQERHLGTWEHSRVQVLLGAWFEQHRKEWGVLSAPEWRVRVSPSRVRIPDLIVVPAKRQTPILEEAPVLVVEILSPEDTITNTKRRAADYFNMGVKMVWIIDPEDRWGSMCEGNTWTDAKRLTVPGTDIYVVLDEIFSQIDVTV